MKIHSVILSAALIAVGVLAGTSAQAQDGTLPNYMFSQYYTPPGASAATAALYPAPLPVPANVGHSYYTYQPLMPHEMMYMHSRNYYNYYADSSAFYTNPPQYPCGGGLTKTTVKWMGSCGANHMGPLPGSLWPVARMRHAVGSRWYTAPYQRGAAAGSCGSAGCQGGCQGGCNQ